MAWWDSAPLAPAAAPSGGGDWWHAAPLAEDSRETKPPKEPARGMMGDVGMAVLSSPQEAATRVAGIPQGALDLVQTAGKVMDWVPRKVIGAGADALGLDKYADIVRNEPRQRIKMAPDTQDIKSGADVMANALNKAAGGQGDSSMFYKPQTPEGKIVQETTTGALSGGPLGKMGALSGALGGLAGETGGQALKGTPLEEPARIAGNIAGGGLPFVGRNLLQVARPGELLADRMSDISALPKGQQDHVVNLAQQIMDEGNAGGLKLLGPEAYAQAMAESGVGTPDRLMLLQRKVEQSKSGSAATSPVIGARPAAVRQAGDTLMSDTFGPKGDAELAVGGAQKAAEKTLQTAERARTDLTQGRIEGTKALSADVPGLDQLKADIDARIKLSGPDTNIGRTLGDYRTQLDQGTKARAAAEQQLLSAGLSRESPAFAQSMKQAGFTEGEPLGPLVTMNREFAERLRQRYDPTAGPNQSGFDKAVVGELTPLNKRLTELLGGGESAPGVAPQYGGALKDYGRASEPINAMYESGLGRMAQTDKGDVGGRLTQMSDEFLSPDTNPVRIRTLAQQLGQSDPEAMKNLVGARLRSTFDNATKDLQGGPNPFGGAKFVTELMANRQQAQNLEATVRALPNGDRLWPAWQKMSRVLQATGKRLPRGSDTEANMALSKDLGASNSTTAKLATSPMKFMQNLLDTWTVNRNGAKLGEVFTHPQAARKMLELAVLDPAKHRAQMVAAQVLNLLNDEPNPETKE